MLKLASRAAVAAFMATVSSQALAQSSTWKISEVSGAVSVRHGDRQVKAAQGMSVAPGDAIVTGQGARAILVHDRDFVTVASNSRVRIPAEQAASGLTRIFQEIGNALFRIEKRGAPHFAVDTPYLAAVVKGTTFSITVGAENTSLQVTEGVVEVATVDGGARDLVRPGSIAMIAAGDRYRLSISGDQSRVIDSPQRTAPPSAPVPNSGATPQTSSATEAAGEQPAMADQAGEVDAVLLTGATPVETPPNSVQTETIGLVITSKPVDLGEVTGGMVTGRSPVVLASASTVSVAHEVAPPSDRGPGKGGAGGDTDGSAGNGGSAGTPPSVPGGSEGPGSVDDGAAGGGTDTGHEPADPGKGGGHDNGNAGGNGPGTSTPPADDGAATPGKGHDKGPDAGNPGDGNGSGPGADKPGNDKGPGAEKPGKDDKGPGADKPGKDDKGPGAEQPGKDDKGPGADKPGKGDKGADVGRPGEDDKGPDVDKPGKDDNGPGAEKPGTDDKGPDVDKPGKDDKGPEVEKPGTDDKGPDVDKPGKDDKGPEVDKPGTDDKGPDIDKPGKDDKGPDVDKPGNDKGPGPGGGKGGKG